MEETLKTNKNYWLVILAAVILLIAIYLLMPQQPVIAPSSLIVDSIQITKVVSPKQNLHTAGLSINFSEKNTDYIYLNAVVDFNQDGQFANYDTSEGTQTEWVVYNMPIPIDSAEPVVYSFLLMDDQIITKNNFSGVIMLSKDRITDWSGQALVNNFYKQFSVPAIATEEIDSIWDIQQPENYGIGIAQAATIDYEAGHTGMPDISQGKNECAPVSTANSLLWMAEKYKFSEKMPDSQEALITELKNDLKWDVSSGVYPNDFKAGKDAFMTRHKIPVVTKKFGGSYEESLFENIYQELKKGCDVEVVLQYKKSDGTLVGAHMVTVVGTYRYSDRSTTESNLSIHDPLSSGEAKSDIYRLNPRDNNRLNNYRYGANAFVKEAFSECYMPQLIDDGQSNTDPQTPQTPANQPGVDITYGQAEVPAIEITDYNFTHKIGTSPCPQKIGNVKVSGQGQWQLESELPDWLEISPVSGKVPGSFDLNFNCILEKYETQDVSTSLDLKLIDKDNQFSSVLIKIQGHIEK